MDAPAFQREEGVMRRRETQPVAARTVRTDLPIRWIPGEAAVEAAELLAAVVAEGLSFSWQTARLPSVALCQRREVSDTGLEAAVLAD